MMQAEDLDAGDITDHLFHDGPRRLDEMRSNLFQQFSAFGSLQRFDELLFGRGQYSHETHHQ